MTLRHLARRAIPRLRHTARYHSPQQHPTGAPVTLADTIRQDLTDGLAYTEGLLGRLAAAAPGILTTLDRYTSEPLVEDVLTALETIPQARAVLEPVLAGLKLLATPAATTGPADQQPAA